MYRANLTLERARRNELERLVEPLASFICAADQPRAALMSALELLFSEVERTNSAATAHVATFSGDRWS